MFFHFFRSATGIERDHRHLGIGHVGKSFDRQGVEREYPGHDKQQPTQQDEQGLVDGELNDALHGLLAAGFCCAPSSALRSWWAGSPEAPSAAGWETARVVAGDAVPLNAGGSHGLQNDSDKPLLVFVIECKMTREAKLETEKVTLHLRGAASDMIAEIEKSRYSVCDRSDTALQNIIDEIVGLYLSTLYKLRFLA